MLPSCLELEFLNVRDFGRVCAINYTLEDLVRENDSGATVFESGEAELLDCLGLAKVVQCTA